MSLIFKQSTARPLLVGPILDGDGAVVTDVAVGDLLISKNGGSPASLNGSATLTHDHAGHYILALTAGDLDTVGSVQVTLDDDPNAMKPAEVTVVEEAVYDAFYAASALGYVANAPVNVTQFGGSNGTFSSGRPEVNTTLIEGSDATNQIRDAVVDDATRIDASALNTLSGHDPGETIMGATDLGTGSGLTSLATASALTTVGNNVSTAVTQTTAANIRSAVGLTSANLNTQLTGIAGDLTTASGHAENAANASIAIKVTTDKLDDTLEDESGWRFTEAALAEAPSGEGGEADWTADERTAIRAILGVPASGTTPDDPSSGILDAIRDTVATTQTRLGAPADFGGGQSIAENLADIVGSATFSSETDSLEAISDAVATRASQTSVDAIDGIVDDILADTGTDGVALSSAARQALIESLFTYDATATYASADAGSLVKQIADNATAAVSISPEDITAIAEETAEAVGAEVATGVWSTALPGSFTSGQAGKIVGDNLNATVGSRASQTSVDDVPTNSEFAAALPANFNTLTIANNATAANVTRVEGTDATDYFAALDDAVLSAIAALNNLSAAGVRAAVGLSSANLDAQLGDLPTNAELATSQAAADDATLAAIAALNNLSSAAVQAAAEAALAAYKALKADAPYDVTTENGSLETTFETP